MTFRDGFVGGDTQCARSKEQKQETSDLPVSLGRGERRAQGSDHHVCLWSLTLGSAVQEMTFRRSHGSVFAFLLV